MHINFFYYFLATTFLDPSPLYSLFMCFSCAVQLSSQLYVCTNHPLMLLLLLFYDKKKYKIKENTAYKSLPIPTYTMCPCYLYCIFSMSVIKILFAKKNSKNTLNYEINVIIIVKVAGGMKFILCYEHNIILLKKRPSAL